MLALAGPCKGFRCAPLARAASAGRATVRCAPLQVPVMMRRHHSLNARANAFKVLPTVFWQVAKQANSTTTEQILILHTRAA